MQVALDQPMQRAMPLLGEMRRPQKVDAALLRSCDSELDAIHLCIHLSRFAHYVIAEKLGIDRGHWTRMMQGRAHFPTNKMKALMEVCGNLAPAQWLNASLGYEMFEDPKAKRREELLRELQQLDAVGGTVN